MTRRELLGSLLVLPLISGCGPSYSVVTASEQHGIVTVDFAELSDASMKPHDVVVVRAKNLIHPIYVFHHQGNYRAFGGTCTHKGCELQLEGEVLACPCHGSEFGSGGQVLSGPATENLKEFRVSQTREGLVIMTS